MNYSEFLEITTSSSESINQHGNPEHEHPIHSLPNEIISNMFAMNEDHDPALPRLLFRTVVAISQVCHKWRAISLATPDMWAACFDYGLGEKWVAELILRSRNRKLAISIPSFTPLLLEIAHPRNFAHRHEFEELIKPDNTLIDVMLDSSVLYEDRSYPGNPLPEDTIPFNRCHRLSLLCRDDNDWDVTYPVVEDQLSQLEYLALCNANRFQSEFRLMMQPNANGMNASLPWNLETLHLRYCTLPFEIPVFKSLKTLTVTGHVSQTNLLTPTAWLNALENMPQLEHLTLIQAIGTNRQANQRIRDLAPSATLPINLPHLKTLHLQSTLTRTTFLLRRMYRPDGCSLRLELGIDKMDHDFFKFCRRLANVYNGSSSSAPCNTIEVHCRLTMCRVIGVHSTSNNSALFDVTLDYIPGPSQMRHPLGQRTDAFTPSAPLLYLLSSFERLCHAARVVSLAGIQIRGFPYQRLFVFFPGASTLVLGHATRQVCAELVHLEDNKFRDREDKENADFNDDNDYSLLPSLTLIQYLETDTDLTDLSKAFSVPVVSLCLNSTSNYLPILPL